MLLTMDLHYHKCVTSNNFSTKKACWIMQVTIDLKILQRKWIIENLLIAGKVTFINIFLFDCFCLKGAGGLV